MMKYQLENTTQRNQQYVCFIYLNINLHTFSFYVS